MDAEKTVSMKTGYALGFGFLLLGILMIALPLIELVDMLSEIRSDSEFITLDLGVYYFFGGGVFFIVMVVGLVYPKLFNKQLSPGVEKLLIFLFLSGITLMFILPYAMQTIIDEYMHNNRYIVCEAKSSQWLHVRTIVYTKSLSCD